MSRSQFSYAALCCTVSLALGTLNLVAATENRVSSAVNDASRITLAGHMNPRINGQNDLGAVNPSLVLPRLTIYLKRSAAQQADLNALLASQLDPSSPRYHKWLTPEQFADRFGVSDADLSAIQGWLTGKGLSVLDVSRAHAFVAISGTAAQVSAAFGTSLHYYKVNGVQHFANSTAPSIPAAFQQVIGQVHGLTDFRMKAPRLKVHSASVMRPRDTSGPGNYNLAPGDVSVIYDLASIYAGGDRGTGLGIVVVGQTGINTSDLDQFRSYFGLSGSDPQVVLVPGTRDPGIDRDELGEADLDLEWSSAIAPASNVTYVYSFDVDDAVTYAVDQNLAPVISMSYGSCELDTPESDAESLQSLAQQANSEGITWVAASGDSGATDCWGDGEGNDNNLSVDLPASIPEVTGMGGTEFAEGTGTYWNATNSAGFVSALSYIPETAWNDSVQDGEPSATGGGASAYFSKPSWQSGTGVPADGARDVPDIALSASADHDGYMIYTDGQWEVVGGTSAPVPIFSGITALLNDYLISSGFLASPGLGNVNPVLYTMAQTGAGSFHDISTGNNQITPSCSRRSTCSTTAIGFTAGVGYDQVTGLGTLDVANLFKAWSAAAASTPKTTSEPPVISAVVNGASFQTGFAPGEIVSAFGTNLTSTTAGAPSIPLPEILSGTSASINGVAAPLFYVSPTQINLQIPYEIAAGTTAVLTISNGGLTGTYTFPVTGAAPGIFTTSSGVIVPSATVIPGGITTLYMTGDGAVSPTVATGSAPPSSTSTSDLPKPIQPVTVTVDGVTAPIEFIGIPWIVGVTQINFQVPSSAPAGTQNVIVTVGGVASPAAKLMVQ